MRNKGANRNAVRRKRAPRRAEPPTSVSVFTKGTKPVVAYIYFGWPVRFLPTVKEWADCKKKGNWAYEEVE